VDSDYQELVATRLPALLRYAHLLTGDPRRADDAVQTALARTLLRRHRIERTGNPEAYVRKAILNQVIIPADDDGVNSRSKFCPKPRPRRPAPKSA
jgi:DNA-directed RNA polymerase specialized sigma24 family protein